MNICIQCINHHTSKTQKGLEKHTCSKYKTIITFGKLGNEPIVENCGEFVQLREYRK